MASDSQAVIDISRVLIKGLKVESIEDVGVLTVPKVVSGGKTPVKFRSMTGLAKERGELLKVLTSQGISRPVALAVVTLHRQQPLAPRIGTNEVMEETIRTNLIRRAQYLLNAARRLQHEADDQKSLPGNSKLSVTKAIVESLKTEARYYQLHLQASRARELGASKVDIAAALHGTKLGWYAVVDDRTTKDCLQANGKNFYTTKRPVIGWPGVGPHMNCRCYAGPPHDTSATVYGIRGD